MKLSIITITYNNIEGFKQTLDSVVSQSWKEFEWIVIDGGSDDGTRELLEQNQQHFTYWCSEKDGGIYYAQNKGAQHASGEYLCFMNAGDRFIDNETLAKVSSYFDKADILFGDTIFSDGKIQETVYHPEIITLSWLSRYAINHQSSFIRREVFSLFGFDVKYKMLADRKFWLQCMLADKTFKKLPFITTLYDANGLSSKNKDKWQHEHQEICDELFPKSIQHTLNSAHSYEASLDMHKTYQILLKEGPLRKLLHLVINGICKARGIIAEKNQYATEKK